MIGAIDGEVLKPLISFYVVCVVLLPVYFILYRWGKKQDNTDKQLLLVSDLVIITVGLSLSAVVWIVYYYLAD